MLHNRGGEISASDREVTSCVQRPRISEGHPYGRGSSHCDVWLAEALVTVVTLRDTKFRRTKVL